MRVHANDSMVLAVPSGPSPVGSHERVTHTAAQSNLAPPNAPIAERLRLGGFPLALAFRPRAVGPLGPGLHGLGLNPNGQGATSSKPGSNGQEAQSGKSAPTASGPAPEIQRYRPPQSAAAMGHQAPAPKLLHTTAPMAQLHRRPSSPPLTSDAQRVLQNPELAAAILSLACQTRQFNPAWIINPTCGNWWSFSVKLDNHLVPSAGEFPTERKAKGETALKALKVMFDDMGVSRNEILQRYYLSCSRQNRPAATISTPMNRSDMGPVTTLINRDVDMTGTDRMNLNRSTLSSTSASSGASLNHQSMSVSGGAPILNSANLASRTAQLRASSGLPSASQELHRPATAPSGRGSIDEGLNILESLGLVATSGWAHTQPPEMSNAFLQGLAAGAQLSQMLFQNAHNEGGRSSRHYRERDRQPRGDRGDRRSRSPTSERQSATAARRSRDPSLKLENDGLQGIESRRDYHSPPRRETRLSTDRYRPNYESKMSKAPDVAIKKEVPTETRSLLGATPGVAASSSGAGSGRRSSTASTRRGPSFLKPMPKNEKWDHDGFAQHYPSGPKM
jgi:hypothetical protein